MHQPGRGVHRGAGQWDWVGQLVGEEIWEQVQESLRAARSGGFPHAGTGGGAAVPPAPFPFLDLYLTSFEVVLSVALPGLASPEQVVVSLADPVTAVLEVFVEPAPPQAVALHRERQAGYLSRRIALPGPVVPGAVQAGYEHGILELRLRLAQPGHGESSVSLLSVTGEE